MIITHYYIIHYYVLLQFLLLHCYYIIITYYYILIITYYYDIIVTNYYIIITSSLHHHYIFITSLFPIAKTGNNELIITYYALSLFSILYCYSTLSPLLPIITCYQLGNLQMNSRKNSGQLTIHVRALAQRRVAIGCLGARGLPCWRGRSMPPPSTTTAQDGNAFESTVWVYQEWRADWLDKFWCGMWFPYQVLPPLSPNSLSHQGRVRPARKHRPGPAHAAIRRIRIIRVTVSWSGSGLSRAPGRHGSRPGTSESQDSVGRAEVRGVAGRCSRCTRATPRLGPAGRLEHHWGRKRERLNQLR